LSAPRPDRRELALLFVGALAVRLAVVAGASRVTGWAPLDLAMLADGHADMVLSKSFPSLYEGTTQLVPFVAPWRDDPFAFFTRFPVYPSAIGLVSLVLSDRRIAALAIAQLVGALAVVRFRLIAGLYTARAGLAAAIFAVFPATWLETTSLAYTEGLLVFCAISAFYAWTGGRLLAAIAWGGVAAVVQKHGFVVLVALGLAQLASGRRGIRDLAPFALGLLPPFALGLWFWALSGDPFTVLERNGRLFGDGGAALAWPFTAFVNGLVTVGREFPSYFWPRKALLFASLVFYVGTIAAALQRREAREMPLVLWLGTILAFCACMGGVWAYYYFPRYVLLGAPAAVLLAVDRIRWPQSAVLRSAAVAGIAVGCMVTAVFGAKSTWDLCMHIWTPLYYEQLRPLLH
jgi:hypothetical protein